MKEKYLEITSWFENGSQVDLTNEMTQVAYEDALNSVEGINEKVSGITSDTSEQATLKEFLLTALAAFSILERKDLRTSVSFQDYFSSVIGGLK